MSVKPHSDATFTTSATLVAYGGSARETVAPVAVTAWKSPSLVAAAVEAAAAAAELISIGEECCVGGGTAASRTPAPTLAIVSCSWLYLKGYAESVEMQVPIPWAQAHIGAQCIHLCKPLWSDTTYMYVCMESAG
eukprot:COSAG01_NODE_39939_length_470_cov_0.522911_1_plen_134_part_01